MTALTASSVYRSFRTSAGERAVLTDVSFEAHAGELVVVRGPSGSGKTTLLNILGALDAPTSGSVRLGDDELTTMSEGELVAARRESLGYIFQSFGLLPVLSAAENVGVPLRIRSVDPVERDARVAEMLALVGLSDHAEQRPDELSGGQQQRVGIARALASRPRVLLADEPTGQLDSATAHSVMELIAEVVRSESVAAVIATHDPVLITRADTVLELHDGRLSTPHRGRHALL